MECRKSILGTHLTDLWADSDCGICPTHEVKLVGGRNRRTSSPGALCLPTRLGCVGCLRRSQGDAEGCGWRKLPTNNALVLQG